MAWKGLGGFTHYEAALPIDFARSDLFLDPATLRGPDAEQAVAGADLEGAISKAATAAYGPGAAEMFGDCRGPRRSTAQIVADPDLLSGTATLWLPVGKQASTSPPRTTAMRRASSWSPSSRRRTRFDAPSTPIS